MPRRFTLRRMNGNRLAWNIIPAAFPQAATEARSFIDEHNEPRMAPPTVSMAPDHCWGCSGLSAGAIFSKLQHSDEYGVSAGEPRTDERRAAGLFVQEQRDDGQGPVGLQRAFFSEAELMQ